VARLVLRRSLDVRRGERVGIEAWSRALPWARAFVLETRRLGATPTLVVEDEEAFYRTLALGPRRRLPTAPAEVAARSDAYVYLAGPASVPRLRALSDGERGRALDRHDRAWWFAARRAGLRAAAPHVTQVDAEIAERFGVDPAAWLRETVRAILVDPARLVRAAHPYLVELARARRLTVRHPNGTDLSASLSPQRPTVEDGRIDAADRRAGRLWTSVPAGFVTVSLAPGSTEGTWESNRPVYDRWSELAVTVGVRFGFHTGRLTEFSFDRGGTAFGAGLAGRGVVRPSALLFGINPAASRGPELGTIAAGNVSLVVGGEAARPEPEASRRAYVTSLAGADVTVDGRRWIRAGRRRRATR
jgi:leucyl aminopeptidase (aminopeptidase T)